MSRLTTLPVVLVTDGEQRSALAVVRSLGRAGYPVHVCSTSGRSIAGASRYCREEFAIADPLNQPDQFAAEASELARRLEAGLVIPISEAALLALASSEMATRGLIPFPPLERVLDICDKARVLSLASQVGIRVPSQDVLQSGDVARYDPAGLSYPVVLKPSRSVNQSGGQRVKLGVLHAADAGEFRRALDRIPAAGFPVLVQQRIVGPGIGIFLLLWNGDVIAQFAHRRLREKPPSGGVSVYRESIVPDPDLLQKSRALLERLGLCGVAMIEYKVDQSSGLPYLMEINGRFWGSLQLAVDSGVDFPRLLAECAAGKPPAPVGEYRAGVRSRWWWGDVDHCLAMLRRSRRALSLPPESPGRAGTMLEFLKLWRPGDRNEILQWSDPRPFLRETVLWFSRK
jgi:predicted ATP-grasp superfamily ATP-dependent carboligase